MRNPAEAGMHFGIVTNYLGSNDGQGRVNLEIAREAVRQGHTLTIVSERVDQSVMTMSGVRAVLYPPPRWLASRLLRDQLFACRSRGHLRRLAGGYDALLTNGFCTWTASDLNCIHFVHAAWRRTRTAAGTKRPVLRRLYANIYGRLNAWLEKHALHRCRHVVAVSAMVQDELRHIGVDAARIHVIANGVDITEFAPGAAERQRFGLPGNAVIALFAGDITTSRKNLDTVLRAMALTPAVHLAVAGGCDRSPYPAMARSMGMGDRVHFLGFERDMPALMRSVDMFILPSRYEPFGLAILEAMASGLPVLTSRQAGVSCLIAPDAGCVLEDSEDAATIATWMAALAGDAAARRRAGDAARRVAEANCWPAMARRYVHLLTEAANTRARS
jgi:glycosyltransferase involved in cell wall biosynthesis